MATIKDVLSTSDPMKRLELLREVDPPVIHAIPQPSRGKYVCYDCGEGFTNQAFVYETRQTSGGGQGDLYPVTYSGDFSRVLVHADRRICIANNNAAVEREKREHDPFYDVPAS